MYPLYNLDILCLCSCFNYSAEYKRRKVQTPPANSLIPIIITFIIIIISELNYRDNVSISFLNQHCYFYCVILPLKYVHIQPF